MSSNVPIPGTGITAFMNESPWTLKVYYQVLDGKIQESKCGNDGVWTNSQVPFVPLTGSPLASVAWDQGKEVVVYHHVLCITWTNGYASRFVCTTLTPNISSKSLPTLMAEAGIRGKLAN